MMSAEQAKKYRIFNRIQYWLGVPEISMIVFEILFEMAGYMALASLCGVLGIGTSQLSRKFHYRADTYQILSIRSLGPHFYARVHFRVRP